MVVHSACLVKPQSEGEFELKLALEFVKNAAWNRRCYDVIIGRILLFLKSVEGRLVPGRLEGIEHLED
jgi:hypothetical protein